MLVVTPLGIYTVVAAGFPDRFPPVLRWNSGNDRETMLAYRYGTCFLPQSSDVFAKTCVDKGPDEEPLIFLWGTRMLRTYILGFAINRMPTNFA